MQGKHNILCMASNFTRLFLTRDLHLNLAKAIFNHRRWFPFLAPFAEKKRMLAERSEGAVLIKLIFFETDLVLY